MARCEMVLNSGERALRRWKTINKSHKLINHVDAKLDAIAYQQLLVLPFAVCCSLLTYVKFNVFSKFRVIKLLTVS